MSKIINYIKCSNYRLISPIGGNLDEHEKNKYSYDLNFSCIDDVDICKSLGFRTTKLDSGLEYVNENQVNDICDLEELKKVNYKSSKQYADNINALKEMRKKEDKLIGGGSFGMFTTAGAMLEASKTVRLCIKNPQFLEEVLEFITNYIIQLARESQRDGADFFWIAEPMAVMLSPKQFVRFSAKYINRVSKSVDIPLFLHVCGDTTKINRELLYETGARCLSVDYMVDMRNIIFEAPRDTIIMGNINPMLLKFQSEDDVRVEARNMIENMRNFQNYIVSTGCLLPNGTPAENIKIIFEENERIKLHSNEEYERILNMIDIIKNKDDYYIRNEVKKNDYKNINSICFEELLYKIIYDYNSKKEREIAEKELLRLKYIFEKEDLYMDHIMNISGKKVDVKSIYDKLQCEVFNQS